MGQSLSAKLAGSSSFFSPSGPRGNAMEARRACASRQCSFLCQPICRLLIVKADSVRELFSSATEFDGHSKVVPFIEDFPLGGGLGKERPALPDSAIDKLIRTRRLLGIEGDVRSKALQDFGTDARYATKIVRRLKRFFLPRLDDALRQLRSDAR